MFGEFHVSSISPKSANARRKGTFKYVENFAFDHCALAARNSYSHYNTKQTQRLIRFVVHRAFVPQRKCAKKRCSASGQNAHINFNAIAYQFILSCGIRDIMRMRTTHSGGANEKVLSLLFQSNQNNCQ